MYQSFMPLMNINSDWTSNASSGLCINLFMLPYSGLFPWGANFCYFRGSPGCHKIFYIPTKFTAQCSAVYMCSNLDRRRFCYVSFCNLHLIDCVLDPQGPHSHAVPCVMAEEVNREV